MLIFKIGSESYPATKPELKSFARALKKARKKNHDLIWHHAIDVIHVPDDTTFKVEGK